MKKAKTKKNILWMKVFTNLIFLIFLCRGENGEKTSLEENLKKHSASHAYVLHMVDEVWL